VLNRKPTPKILVGDELNLQVATDYVNELFEKVMSD
jgi:hypothetical protein